MSPKRSAINRGKRWERTLMEWFRDRHFRTEHLRLVGQKDEGDLAVEVENGLTVLVEAKSPGETGRLDIGAWLAEAETEARHYAAARRIDEKTVIPVVVIQKETSAGVSNAWVVMRLGEFAG